MAVRLGRRREAPVDSSELVSKALVVAQTPTALMEIPERQRRMVDQVAKAINNGATWSQPGASTGTIAQMVRRRPVSAEIVARHAASALAPSGSNITPIDIETAMRAQGMDWVAPFAPGAPLTPFYGYNKRPRERDYLTARNNTTQTRTGRIPYQTLGHMMESYDVATICMRHAIQDLRSMRVRFEVMDGYEKPAVKELARAKEFWRRPDGKLSLRNWMCKHGSDVWRFDAGVMYRQRDRAGNLIRLPIAEGTLFAPLLDYFGARPEGQAPAYQQIVQGIPWDWLREEDLIYEPMWPHSEDPYGTPPIETVLINANTDIRLQMYFLQFFTTGTVPEAFATAPEDQSDPDSLADWQEVYNDWSYGDQAERWGLRWLPHGTEITPYKPQEFDPDVAEYVMRRTVAAFMMTPQDLGLTEDVNRSTSETQVDTQFRINSLPNVGYYEDIMDSITQEDLGLPVQCRFDTGREKEDRLMEAQAHAYYVGMAAESPDEVREKVLGYPINPLEKVPRFFDSQRLGPIPIAYLLATAGDVDPLTGAPRPGTVVPRDLILPGQTQENPIDPSASGPEGKKPVATERGGAGPKAPERSANPTLPLQDQLGAAPTASRPALNRGPNPHGSGAPSSQRRTSKEATAGITVATGIAGTPDTEPEEDDGVAKDLYNWRRQSRKRVARGDAPRPFANHSIPPGAYEYVWNRLEKATTRVEVDAAFTVKATAGTHGKRSGSEAPEAPIVTGLALVARSTSRVLMVQRANKDDS